MTGKVLILGGSGRFGRNATEAFARAGWEVRQFNRETGNLPQSASDVDLIVNGWNPPYDRWAAEIPQATRAVIDAAQASGATVLIPGNVYVFGENTPGPFSVSTPHAAENPLGRIRRDMEAAYRSSGVRTIVLRMGDFIDTIASGNWFDRIMIAQLNKKRFVYPGDPDAPHAWAWLPDAARAAVALAERRSELEAFEEVPFPGYTLSGRELAAATGEALGEELALSHMNWLPIRIAAPFWQMGRHLLEMRYLWSKPHSLDGTAFDSRLPGFDHTPVARALAIALGKVDIDPNKPVAGPA